MRLDHARRHPPRPVRGDASRAPGVIGGVRGVLDIELFLQAPARLKQPVSPVLGDRAALALALLLPARGGPHAPTRAGPADGSRTAADLARPPPVVFVVGRLSAARARAPGAPWPRAAPGAGPRACAAAPAARRRARRRRARPRAVDLGRFSRISRAIWPKSRFALIDALAAIFVPSIATTPTDASPARAHSPSTPRTPHRTRAHVDNGTPRSSSDPARGCRPRRDTPRLPRMPARCPATSDSRGHRSTATTRPSSTAHRRDEMRPSAR